MKKLNKIALDVFAIIALNVYTTITNACIVSILLPINILVKLLLIALSVFIILCTMDYYVKLFMKVCYDKVENLDDNYYLVETDYRQDVIHVITFFKMLILPFIITLLAVKEVIKWLCNIFKNGLFDK